MCVKCEKFMSSVKEEGESAEAPERKMGFGVEWGQGV